MNSAPSARSFASRLVELLRREQACMADFLCALADFDRGRLWESLGHTNLFSFLFRHLGLSRSAAFYRHTAVQLVHRFPEVVAPLRDGRLCLTSIVELARVITPENREQVLPRFFHLSKREAREVAAEIAPREAPPRREIITACRPAEPTQRKAGAPACSERTVTSGPSAGAGPGGTTVHDGPRAGTSPLLGPAAKPWAEVEPLTGELRRLHVTVSKRFLQKLEDARASLSHGRPRATAEEILEAGLDLLLAQDAKRKGEVVRPRKKVRPSAPDRFPARVRREIWRRDGGRCQWKFDSGEICGSNLRVELDHIQPLALGGASTVENGRVLCAAHNQLAARHYFGDGWMDECATAGRSGPASGTTVMGAPPGDAVSTIPP